MAKTFKPTPKQELFLKSDADILLFGGSAGGGKSLTLIIDALGLNDIGGPRISNKKYRGLIIRKQYKHLVDLIDKTRDWYPYVDSGANLYITQSNMEILIWCHYTFRKYRDTGADGAIAGIEIQYCGIDELSQMKDDRIFRYCLSRLRSSDGLKCYMRCTSNPGRNRWVKDLFRLGRFSESSSFVVENILQDGSIDKKRYQYIRAMLCDNPHLPREYESMLNLLPEDERAALLYGDWDAFLSVDGQIYKSEIEKMNSENRYSSVKYQPGFDVYAAFDLGIGDNTAVILFQICGKEIHIFDAFEDNGKSIAHYTQELINKGFSNAHIILPHDSGQRSLQTGLSMEEKIKQQFSEVTVLPRISTIEDGISHTKEKFHYVWLDKSCERLYDCLCNYRRKYNSNIDLFTDPIHDQFSHYADAFRYALQFEKKTKLTLDVADFGYNYTY